MHSIRFLATTVFPILFFLPLYAEEILFELEQGTFDGNTAILMRSPGRFDRVEIELRVRPERIEQDDDWESLVATGDWDVGCLRFCFRAGKIVAIVHQGGMNRARLESPILKNDTWYRVRLQINADESAASLELDGKEIARTELDPVVENVVLSNLAVGAEAKNQQFDENSDYYLEKVRHRSFRGQIADLVIRGEKSEEPIGPQLPDSRNIEQGFPIPNESYCDQPYILVLKDGTWLCTLTTGEGHEGSRGQHIVATRSSDRGKTWRGLIDIEPASDISASWVVPLLTNFGRIYAFYTINADSVRLGRDDTHGWYAFRYSDDDGLTWSERRRIPMRRTACDTLEKDGESIQMFWGICKPRIEGDEVFIPFTKLGKYFLEMGEGWVWHSDNILDEKNVDKVRFNLLPDGEHGIRHPEFGSVQEEHNLVPLNEKDAFYCVYRTTNGFPAFSVSRDRCRSWSKPQPMRYADGRTIRHPRACPMIWKCSNGKYLFWFHNNSGKSFENRNPVWISGGIERNGDIFWSQPEILLYADQPAVRMSYPDLIEQDGKYWVTETQKEVGRVHEIDTGLLNGMWSRLEDILDQKPGKIVREGMFLETEGQSAVLPEKAIHLPTGKGLTLDLEITVPENGFADKHLLLDNRDADANGIVLYTGENGTFEVTISASMKKRKREIRWTSDSDLLKPGKCRISIIVDTGPKIIMGIVDGKFIDGNGGRIFGWNRYITTPSNISGSGIVTLSSEVGILRLYDRPLKTFEILSNHTTP